MLRPTRVGSERYRRTSSSARRASALIGWRRIHAGGDGFDTLLNLAAAGLPLIVGHAAQGGQVLGAARGAGREFAPAWRRRFGVAAIGGGKLGAGHLAEPAGIGGFFQPAVLDGQRHQRFVVGQHGAVVREDAAATWRGAGGADDWLGGDGAVIGAVAHFQRDQAAVDRERQGHEGGEEPAEAVVEGELR